MKAIRNLKFFAYLFLILAMGVLALLIAKTYRGIQRLSKVIAEALAWIAKSFRDFVRWLLGVHDL